MSLWKTDCQSNDQTGKPAGTNVPRGATRGISVSEQAKKGRKCSVAIDAHQKQCWSLHSPLWSPGQKFLLLSVPYFLFSTLSGPASLPAPLGKSLLVLGQQLGRYFISIPLDVAHLGRCHGGHCPGLGDREKQARHSSFASCFASTRRGRVGAVGLGLLFVERRGIDFALQRLLFGACV